MDNTGMNKAGYAKIKFCGEQAAIDKLKYFWVDTCCIDKSSSAELTEAINSMFHWYRQAAKCYVYLSDVTIHDNDQTDNLPQSVFRNSRWFTRGWTLQELIAPTSVEFFSLEGKRIGDKKSLEKQIHEITKINVQALRGVPLSNFNVADRMSWAEKRNTTREEDRAYCLLGIFDIHMPLIYGEGKKAFIRLNMEIDSSSKTKASKLETLPTTMPFQRDPDFVDRGSILDQMNEKCVVSGSKTALVGLGGIGKSQLAIEYAYRLRDQLPQTWVFWIHASNAARFEQGYRKIADKVNIPGRNDPKADILKLVQDWLQIENKQQWFLILDNFDDATFLAEPPSSSPAARDGVRNDTRPQPLSDYLPRGENGSILITTRSRDAALTLLEERDIIVVDSMDKEDAELLFHKKLQLDDGKDIANVPNLVALLEFMPLAIVQAAAYIAQRAPRCSVRQYIEKFQKSDMEKTRLLDDKAGHLRRDSEAKSSILITWELSFDHVRLIRPSAANLLSLMSFFDRQGIPEDLIHSQGTTESGNKNGRIEERGTEDKYNESDSESDDDKSESESDEEFENDIKTLRQYSFISIGVDKVVFEMHALVQLAMRKWLEKHGHLEEWKQKYIKKLCEEFPNGEYENWQKCMTLYPHAKGAITQKPTGEDSIKEWSTLLYNAAWYAWRRGIISDAENFSVKSMKATKKLFGSDHVETLCRMTMVSLVYRLGGRWKEAEDLEVQVMEMIKRILGPEHPDTLTSMANLASTYRNQGRWKEAEDLEVQVMGMRKRILGPEHPDTLTSMANLASTYRNQGRWKEAEDLQKKELEICSRVLSEEHPDTLTSMANLASTYRNQGHWKEAEDLEVQVMEMRKRVSGPEHPDTLTSMANLASTFWNQGHWKEAEDLEVQVMEMRKRISGPEHPDTLTSMANLASTYRNQGRWKEAEDLQKKEFEVCSRVLGAEHPDTLISMANLASILECQGRYSECVELMATCVHLRERILGPNHPYTISSIEELRRWETELEISRQ